MSEIAIHIQSEDDFYNTLDPDKTTLRSEVADYIAAKYDGRKRGETVTVRVIADSDLDEYKLKNTLREHMQSILDQGKKERRFNQIKQLRLFVVGIIFIVLGLVLDSKIDSVIAEVISVIGSFSIWEATSIWLVQNPELRFSQMLLKKGTKDIVVNVEYTHKTK